MSSWASSLNIEFSMRLTSAISYTTFVATSFILNLCPVFSWRTIKEGLKSKRRWIVWKEDISIKEDSMKTLRLRRQTSAIPLVRKLPAIRCLIWCGMPIITMRIIKKIMCWERITRKTSSSRHLSF
jgi:hypothetical protein